MTKKVNAIMVLCVVLCVATISVLFVNKSSEEFNKNFKIDLRDYKNGKWDGSSIRVGDSSCRNIIYRTYQWMGYVNGQEEEKELNIDYKGSLPIETNDSCTFAINYSTGKIEKWEFFKKKDSWKIPKGETISSVCPLSEATVITIDSSAQQHIYTLSPHGLVPVN